MHMHMCLYTHIFTHIYLYSYSFVCVYMNILPYAYTITAHVQSLIVLAVNGFKCSTNHSQTKQLNNDIAKTDFFGETVSE